MEPYIETLFRHKFLFLFLLILIPTLGVGYAIDQRQVLFQATATVWAEKPSFLDTGQDWNQWITPAQNQAGNVQEFVQTNSFALDVLRQTDLSSRLGNELLAQQTLIQFRRNLAVNAVGTHLIAIAYTDPNPKVAPQVVSAVISTFNKEVLANATSDGSVTIAFYQKQLDDVNAKLADTTAAIRAYLDAHPELGRPSSDRMNEMIASTTFAAQNPQFVSLVQQQGALQKQQQSYQDTIDQLTLSKDAAPIGTQQAFRVMDAPTLPTKPISNLRKFAAEIGLGFGAALGFIVAGTVLLTFLDGTLRSARLAPRQLGLDAYPALPLLRPKRAFFFRRRFRQREVRTLLALQARGVAALPPGR
jgi:uncharacterized protein involved in exopolysaccharide biosynthesis